MPLQAWWSVEFAKSASMCDNSDDKEMTVAYIAIRRCDANRANHEKPIDPRDVDLTMKDL